MAMAAHVQGTVVLRATILRNGWLSLVHVLSGNDLLVPAAVHAVQQWHYKPAELDGKPVETDITVKISFALSR
jgi:TonB family protein